MKRQLPWDYKHWSIKRFGGGWGIYFGTMQWSTHSTLYGARMAARNRFDIFVIKIIN